MPSDAQKRADRKYKAEKTWQLGLRFYPAESDMWDFLTAQDNKQGFVKGLIRQEMTSSRCGSYGSENTEQASGA